MQQKGMGLGGTIHLTLVRSVLVTLVPSEPVGVHHHVPLCWAYVARF